MTLRKVSILVFLLLSSCNSLEAGWRAQHSGDYAEAQRQAIVSLSRDPKNPDVYRLIARTALSQGQYDSALKSARFASSLDGGSSASESLVREICAAKEDWSCICESGLKPSSAPSLEEIALYRKAYASLSNRSSAYGCLKVLEEEGESLEGADAVKLLYAQELADVGQFQRAYEIEQTCADIDVRRLRGAMRLYSLHRTADAEALLRDHVQMGDDSNREARRTEAVRIASQSQDWALVDEILRDSTLARHEVTRGIALRRTFHPEDAEALFAQHFARERSRDVALSEVEELLKAGYAQTAMTALETSSEAMSDEATVLDGANRFYEAGQMTMASQLLMRLSDRELEDAECQIRYFRWAQEHHLSRVALTAGERAYKKGVTDDDFIVELLELYLDNREITAFERESAAWIARSESPAILARTEVARLEMRRKNWSKAVEILEPLDKSGDLTDGALYIRALEKNRDAEALYRAIDKYAPETSPIHKAAYFEAVETEDLFKKSLDPLLHGTAEQQFDAEMAIARFEYDLKSDEVAGASAIDRALKAVDNSAIGYENAVILLKSRDVTRAAEIAQSWQTAYPQDRRPCELLSQIWIAAGERDKAIESLNCLVERSSDKAKALIHGYQDLSRYHEEDAAIAWIENHPLKTTEPMTHLKALTDVYEREVMSHRLDGEMWERWRELAIAGNVALLEAHPQNALDYATSLAAIEAYPESIKAYEVCDQQHLKWSADQQISRVRTMIRGRGNGEQIQAIIQKMSNEDDAFKMLTMLETEQALVYAEPLLEKLLGAQSVNARLKAYTYLVRQARYSGNIKKIQEYSKKLEESAPQNINIRSKLAETALMMNDHDSAVRHLTMILGNRPDSREVLVQIMRLSRQAPEDRGVQSLAQSVLDGAEGNAHRLDWISQQYEQQAEYEKALLYAEKVATATAFVAPELQLRRLKLMIRLGQMECEKFTSLYRDYRSTPHWKPENIEILAQEAQEAGYYEEAMAWMREAIAMSPNDIRLKRHKLEMALESEREGQIALSLDEAITPPVAEVMVPLENKGSWMEAIEAIDKFESMGEYEMALSSLLAHLTPYAEVRGIPATLRALSTWREHVPSLRAEATSVLAKAQLMSDAPCDALAYLDELEDVQSWSVLFSRCPDAENRILESLHVLLNRFSKRPQERFIQAVYDAMMSHHQYEAAMRFAEKTGLTMRAYDKFEQTFYTRGVLEALVQAAHEAIEPDRLLEAFDLLLSHRYLNEAASFAHREFDRIPESMRGIVALKAAKYGKEAPKFERAMNDASYASFAQTQSEDRVTETQIASWLSQTPTRYISPLIDFTMRCATTDKKRLTPLKRELQQRNARTSVQVVYVQSAIAQGLDGEAIEVVEKLLETMPDSTVLYQLKSVAQAHLGQIEDAITTIQEGARQALQPAVYWDQVRSLHADSSVEIRQSILENQRQMAPQSPELLVDAAAIALDRGDTVQAEKWAHLAYHEGDTAILRKLADVWDERGKISSFPDDLIEGIGWTRQSIQAKIDYARGLEDEAAKAFHEAARIAPWPPTAYGELVRFWIEHGNFSKAEQTAALFVQRFPHASSSYATRALYELHRGNTENAWNDYQKACVQAVENKPWVSELLQTAHQLKHDDFALRVIQNERSLGGSFQEMAELNAIFDVSPNASGRAQRTRVE